MVGSLMDPNAPSGALPPDPDEEPTEAAAAGPIDPWQTST
jgi:hypothetical protein